MRAGSNYRPGKTQAKSACDPFTSHLSKLLEGKLPHKQRAHPKNAVRIAEGSSSSGVWIWSFWDFALTTVVRRPRMVSKLEALAIRARVVMLDGRVLCGATMTNVHPTRTDLST